MTPNINIIKSKSKLYLIPRLFEYLSTISKILLKINQENIYRGEPKKLKKETGKRLIGVRPRSVLDRSL